jgi:hypothetical protein
VALALLLVLSGCVHYGQFRDDRGQDLGNFQLCTGPEGDPSRRSHWCPEGNSHYYLAFVEVDEFGEMFDRAQLTHAIALIQCAKRHSAANSAVVVTFIHGWKNNSSDDSGNVWGFRDELNDIAAALGSQAEKAGFSIAPPAPAEDQCRPADYSPGAPRAVVGVYIGWRGAVTRVPVVQEFTFWNRRNAAIRIPGAHLTEVLLDIIHETKACVGPCPRGADSLSVVVGHSFGGMVLERSLTEAVVGDILRQENDRKLREARHEEIAVSNRITPVADLIALVNEAAPATESKQLLDLLKTHDFKLYVGGRQEPLFLSITSTGDWATGLVLPIGQAPSKLTKSFRTYEDPKPPEIPEQSTYYLHSTAHLPPLFSHRLGPMEDPAIQAGINAWQEDHPKANFQDELCHQFKALDSKWYCLVPIPDTYNTTPYWVMQMGTEFVPDHSQIFRPAFRELLTQFLARRIDFSKKEAPLKPMEIR